MSQESYNPDYQAIHDSLEDEAGLQLKMPINIREDRGIRQQVRRCRDMADKQTGRSHSRPTYLAQQWEYKGAVRDGLIG